MKDTLVSLQKNNTDLVKQLAGKTALCDDLQLQNTSLKERLIKAETNKPVGGKPQDISTPPQQTASGDLLIGDSLLRNVKKTNVKDGCRVRCIRGATVSDIQMTVLTVPVRMRSCRITDVSWSWQPNVLIRWL